MKRKIPFIFSIIINLFLVYLTTINSIDLSKALNEVEVRKKEYFNLLDKNDKLTNELSSKSKEYEIAKTEIENLKRKKNQASLSKNKSKGLNDQTNQNNKLYGNKDYNQKYSTKRNPENVYRVGVICRDGTRSYATGRGACSWHGGVKCWIYSDGICRSK